MRALARPSWEAVYASTGSPTVRARRGSAGGVAGRSLDEFLKRAEPFR
jgi:hypothetical protein